MSLLELYDKNHIPASLNISMAASSSVTKMPFGMLWLTASKLSAFFSDKTGHNFNKRVDLFDVDTNIWGAIHYPSACEYDGHLYIIATKAYYDDENQRGAELFKINLDKI